MHITMHADHPITSMLLGDLFHGNTQRLIALCNTRNLRISNETR
uniref:Uncharacterized protein n=1 Tax=Arsenophonus nasoniae TaxID=638 RepID=D2U4P5_9GAMM|nr:hypothetical protein ARN_36710 [Arsenophonus nasoniae]